MSVKAKLQGWQPCKVYTKNKNECTTQHVYFLGILYITLCNFALGWILRGTSASTYIHALNCNYYCRANAHVVIQLFFFFFLPSNKILYCIYSPFVALCATFVKPIMLLDIWLSVRQGDIQTANHQMRPNIAMGRMENETFIISRACFTLCYCYSLVCSLVVVLQVFKN